MSDDLNRVSPLALFLAEDHGVEPSTEAGVHLFERPFMGQINLRGQPTGPSGRAFLEAVEIALGLVPPLGPNTVGEGPEVTALWLGPDEWLVLTPPGQQHRITGALRGALGNLFAAVTDVSAAQTIINIRGPRTRDVLGKGCTLDFHPSVFGPGQCAQTNIAKATAVIRQLDDSPSYDIVVRRSLADYFARWLTDAAREYGLVVS